MIEYLISYEQKNFFDIFQTSIIVSHTFDHVQNCGDNHNYQTCAKSKGMLDIPYKFKVIAGLEIVAKHQTNSNMKTAMSEAKSLYT